MPQVVKFFGWLLLAIGGTLVVFSHLTIGFVYGWDQLVTQVSTDPIGTILSLLAFVPGSIVYGFGVVLDKLAQRSDEKWAAKQAAHAAKKAAHAAKKAANSANDDQAES